MAIKSELWLRLEGCERSLCDASQAATHIAYLADAMHYYRHDVFNRDRSLDMSKWEDEDHLTMITYGDSIDERIFLQVLNGSKTDVSVTYHIIRNCAIDFGMAHAKFAEFVSSRHGAKQWTLTYMEPDEERFIMAHAKCEHT